MAARVVHLSNEHHARFKEYAEKLGEPMTKILEQWIDDMSKPGATTVKMKPRFAPLNIVDSRTPEQKAADGDLPPYLRPPFWANRGVDHEPPTE